MFRRKTTFILGAGASAELGLPIGYGLAAKIATLLRGNRDSRIPFADEPMSRGCQDYLVDRQQEVSYQRINELVRIGLNIASNMPLAPSIDNYLNTHFDDQDRVMVGKLAIARCILVAESGSNLHHYANGQFTLPLKETGLSESWYLPFWHMLITGVDRKDVDKVFANTSFIVFNYDRCLEHFLYLALQRYFGISDKEAADIVSSADIIHAYGKVGGLPWEDDEVKTAFGHTDAMSLYPIAGQIRTFTESVEEGIQARLKRMVQIADTLVFLGFGFIEQNMTLISPVGSDIKRVFATAYGMSESEVAMARRKVGSAIHKIAKADIDAYIDTPDYQANFLNGSCRNLFDGHRLRMPDAPTQGGYQ